jgi:hypothetical protein
MGQGSQVRIRSECRYEIGTRRRGEERERERERETMAGRRT